jgi:hypothetical protein
MGKQVNDAVLDAALNHLKNNSTRLVVCSAEPTTYALAQTNYDTAGYRLAQATITNTDFTGPENGTTSGRKIAVNAQADMDIDGVAAAANATHVALVDTVNELVLYVTTCTSQSLTGGNKVNTPSWEVEIRDPA